MVSSIILKKNHFLYRLGKSWFLHLSLGQNCYRRLLLFSFCSSWNMKREVLDAMVNTIAVHTFPRIPLPIFPCPSTSPSFSEKTWKSIWNSLSVFSQYPITNRVKKHQNNNKHVKKQLCGIVTWFLKNFLTGELREIWRGCSATSRLSASATSRIARWASERSSDRTSYLIQLLPIDGLVRYRKANTISHALPDSKNNQASRPLVDWVAKNRSCIPMSLRQSSLAGRHRQLSPTLHLTLTECPPISTSKICVMSSWQKVQAHIFQ